MKKVSLFAMLIGVLSACSINNSASDYVGSKAYRDSKKLKSTGKLLNQVASHPMYPTRCMRVKIANDRTICVPQSQP